MKKVALSPSKRKIIDLDDNTFKTLSIMAIENGTNLKKYIEELLSSIAENHEEARIYASLTKERPEGQIVLDEREKADLEKWLGV
jgi:hypothetical protein